MVSWWFPICTRCVFLYLYLISCCIFGNLRHTFLLRPASDFKYRQMEWILKRQPYGNNDREKRIDKYPIRVVHSGGALTSLRVHEDNFTQNKEENALVLHWKYPLILKLFVVGQHKTTTIRSIASLGKSLSCPDRWFGYLVVIFWITAELFSCVDHLNFIKNAQAILSFIFFFYFWLTDYSSSSAMVSSHMDRTVGALVTVK